MICKGKKSLRKGEKLAENTKSERIFLIAIALAIVAFFGLVMAFGNSPASNTPVPNGNNVNDSPVQGNGQIQDVYIKALGTGVYDKPTVTVKKGVPVRLHFSAEQNSGCGRAFYMRNFNVQLVSKNGEEQTAQFTPAKEGTYEYSCGMRMFVGKMVVVP